MEPLYGFLLYVAAAAIVWIVASKRGRAGWAFFLACLISAPVLVLLTARAGGTSTAAGFVAFLAPIIAFVAVLAMPTSEQQATRNGTHGDFKKCKFCAESIRAEAVKCKHCGSAIA